ncbi:2-oxo acid dehydrogenase subunit E2 [Nocardia elegans]|uniref:Dihydrolipoamide acetyltransferase component of pyruvate dehydrogenase complex n=1 Tax=Nocardia elegans TaxID=300029 RepID=A0ABW6TL42_9NOCA|nr:2-oxo acid dehydrogenase subunit E2 [Nocardia elegans]MBF6449371.1 2-oxo acid dehydrogenase subunit E2 [Nocardia elegans]
MTEFRMPSLGADMTEGTVTHWFVHPGDAVKRGDIVAEVDTTKAAIEIECFDDGVMDEIRVPEGRTVPVGAVLATITAGASSSGNGKVETVREGRGEPVPSVATSESAGPPESRDRAESVAAPSPVAEPARMTPLIHRLAEEAGLDPATVHGSGPGGRVLRGDIEAAVAQHNSAPAPAPAPGPEAAPASASRPAPAPEAAEAVARSGAQPDVARASGLARRLAEARGLDLSGLSGTGPAGAVRARDLPAEGVPAPAAAQPSEDGTVRADPVTPPPGSRDAAAMRSAIAATMARSKRTVPHYYLSDVVDVSAAADRLRERNAGAPLAERIVMAALLFRAVAGAARRVPQLNGYWIDDEFRPASAVHLGVVVSLRGGGIIVPTIPDADTLDAAEMMAAMRSVVQRARSGRLRSSDATAATITVTNLGDLGVESVFGVIAVPQVAIVGLGAVTDRPCAVDGLLGVRPQVTVTLSADHRASDGATGARFLHTVADLLHQPEEL